MSAIVSCRGITKHYRQGAIDVPALRGIDLDIEKGDFASLAGPSGSGKTTFLNILGGLDRPTDGSVTIDGEEITRLDNNALADLRLRKIGFVFQSYNLDSGAVGGRECRIHPAAHGGCAQGAAGAGNGNAA